MHRQSFGQWSLTVFVTRVFFNSHTSVSVHRLKKSVRSVLWVACVLPQALRAMMVSHSSLLLVRVEFEYSIRPCAISQQDREYGERKNELNCQS